MSGDSNNIDIIDDKNKTTELVDEDKDNDADDDGDNLSDLEQEIDDALKAENNSDSNIYIQSVKLNGDNYNYSYITHKDIMKGGELVFEMGNIPNKSFANDKEFRPKSKMY